MVHISPTLKQTIILVEAQESHNFSKNQNRTSGWLSHRNDPTKGVASKQTDPYLTVGHKEAPKWLALVSGNMDQNLRPIPGLMLTHTPIRSAEKTHTHHSPQVAWCKRKL